MVGLCVFLFFFFQAEDGIRDLTVTGVQTCALPISRGGPPAARPLPGRSPRVRRRAARGTWPPPRTARSARGGRPCSGRDPPSARRGRGRRSRGGGARCREIGRASCRERV